METEGKPPYARLYRSEEDRILAGVCGGLGEHFRIDPVIVRIIMVILALTGGPVGILLYLMFWLIIPRRP
ncbi:MAG TPA: PspC domain-containing protein [Bacteroidetes bacterium]|nr:PspC domain-containing protein [Bacteroidota bacterium]